MDDVPMSEETIRDVSHRAMLKSFKENSQSVNRIMEDFLERYRDQLLEMVADRLVAHFLSDYRQAPADLYGEIVERAAEKLAR